MSVDEIRIFSASLASLIPVNNLKVVNLIFVEFLFQNISRIRPFLISIGTCFRNPPNPRKLFPEKIYRVKGTIREVHKKGS